MNSEATTQPITLAYLAQNRIRLKRGTEVPRTVDSVYGNSIREKAVRAQQKHSWKAAGSDGSPFGGMLWGKPATTGDIPIAITSICGGRDPGGRVYLVASGKLGALLEVGQVGAAGRRGGKENQSQNRL